MNLKDLKEKLLENTEFKEEYDKHDLAFLIGEMIIDLRVKLGLTQQKLAKLVGTQQPSIARLENGSTLPSLRFLDEVAKSVGTYLIPPKFAILENDSSDSSSATLNNQSGFWGAESHVTLAEYLHDNSSETTGINEAILSH